MKELSIEEKAKRYDEAIERGKQILNTPYTAHWDIMKEVVEHILPELKESKDERFKEELKEVLDECLNVRPQIVEEKQYIRLIAWLEKQGEHTNFLDKIQIGDKVTRNKDGVLVNLSQLNRVAKLSKE